MAYTQSQINDIVNSIVNAFTGQQIGLVDDSQLGNSNAPVARYVQALGLHELPGLPTTWGGTFPAPLSDYFTHEMYQNSKQYPKGTILTWEPAQVAIVMQPPIGNTVEVFEQLDTCKTSSRIINDETRVCTFALVPLLTDAPAPPPIQFVTPKPPNAPVPVKLAEKYALVTDVPCYMTLDDAEQTIRSTGKLSAGEYYIYADGFDVLNLSTDNQQEGLWINEAQNVLPPEPVAPLPVTPSHWVDPRGHSDAPVVEVVPAVPVTSAVEAPDDKWKRTYEPFNLPRTYIANQAGRIWNLDETGEDASVMLHKGDHVNVYGIVMRDGEKHYRLKAKRDIHFDWWLCVPQLFNGRAVLVLPAPTWYEKLFKKGQQLKSIFPDSEPKFLDSVRNPYKTKEKK